MSHTDLPQTEITAIVDNSSSLVGRMALVDAMLGPDIKQVLGYDDVFDALPGHQSEIFDGVLGYTRSLPLTIFGLGNYRSHFITGMPLLVQEIDLLAQTLKEMGVPEENFSVWLMPREGDDNLIDLMELGRTENGRIDLHRLIREHGENLPEYTPDMYSNMVAKMIEKGILIPENGTLLLPMQTRDYHQDQYRELINQGYVKLMSSADGFISKTEAAKQLIQQDPELVDYLTNPEVIDTDDLEVSEVGMRILSSRILDICIAKELRGKEAYVKLDVSGVSGLDNLSPSKYPEVYHGTYDERIDALVGILQSRFSSLVKFPTAGVEDRVARDSDRFGVKEYVVSGVQTIEGMHLMCIVRAINDDNDVFQGIIASTDPSKIGISREDQLELTRVMVKAAKAQVKAGYKEGYIAKDFMYDKLDNKFKINDHNDRRGGRSTIEQLMLLKPGSVFMDKDYSFIVPEGQDTIQYAERLAQCALDNGLYVYGTPIIFYPSQDESGHTKIKLKIICEIPEMILNNENLGTAGVVSTMDKMIRATLA